MTQGNRENCILTIDQSNDEYNQQSRCMGQKKREKDERIDNFLNIPQNPLTHI